MAPRRAWLVDASIYIFRAWFSLPERWHSEDGRPLNAVYGYASFLLDFLAATGAREHTAAAFDESLGSCFRNEILPTYKSSRELPDDDLAFQLDTCREITGILGIPCYGGPRFEADDYIADLARLCREAGLPVTIVTRDKDLGQLITGPDDHWWDFAGDLTLDRKGFADKHGVPPEQFADYLALVGDPVDDIPGVPGVGAKTAAALLAHFEDLDVMGRGLSEVAQLPIRGAASVQVKLERHWPQVQVARRLTGLDQQLPGIEKLPEFVLGPESVMAFGERLRGLGIGGQLLRRADSLAQALAS